MNENRWGKVKSPGRPPGPARVDHVRKHAKDLRGLSSLQTRQRQIYEQLQSAIVKIIAEVPPGTEHSTIAGMMEQLAAIDKFIATATAPLLKVQESIANAREGLTDSALTEQFKAELFRVAKTFSTEEWGILYAARRERKLELKEMGNDGDGEPTDDGTADADGDDEAEEP